MLSCSCFIHSGYVVVLFCWMYRDTQSHFTFPYFEEPLKVPVFFKIPFLYIKKDDNGAELCHEEHLV